MAVKLWIDRAKPSGGSRIFHVECSKGGTIPGIPIPTPPIIEPLKHAQMTVVSNDTSVVKVFALKADGQLEQNPMVSLGDGMLAVINSGLQGGGKAGRFMLIFPGTGDGRATVWVNIRHRLTTPQGTAGNFSGRTDHEEYSVIVYNSQTQQPSSAEIIDAAIVEGEPS